MAAATHCHPRLLVTGAGTISTMARQRARELSSDPAPVMILEVHYRVDGVWVKIFNAAGGMPQSLQFNLSISSEYQFVGRFDPKHAAIADRVPRSGQ